MDIVNINELSKYASKTFVDKNKFAPKYPFRYLVVGSSGGGKTNMICNLIIKYLYFDKLYVYSKHLEQSVYNFLRDFFQKAENKIRKKLKIEDEEDDETKIYYEFDSLEDVLPIENLPQNKQILVIFDDFNFSKNQNNIVEYFSRGRHKNVSSIYIAQSYFQTPKNVRINCNYFSFFNIPSNREINLIMSDLPIPVDKETLKKLFTEALKKPYSFLTIDLKTTVKPLMIRKNFDELFISF